MKTTPIGRPVGRLAMIVRALTAIGLFAAAVTFSAPTASADSITVANGAPVANDDNYSVQAGTTLTVPAPGVLANDTDPDGDPITVGGFAGPANGSYSLDPDGTFSYAPDAGFSGTDSVTYFIVDNYGNFSENATAYITVTQAVPTITTQVSAADIALGDSVTDTATLSGLENPSGTVTFFVHGPEDPSCTRPVFLDEVPVTGNTATSPLFFPPEAGTYQFIAKYEGEGGVVQGACNDPNETVVVQPAPPPPPPSPPRCPTPRSPSGTRSPTPPP